MLSTLRWLALEVKYLDAARSFYVGDLDLPVRAETDRELRLGAGDTDLVLRRPDGVPRGGLHTHYAFSVPEVEYDDWWDRLSERQDLVEHRFGSARSLYCYDPDGNCVELGETDAEGPGVTGVFEVVLEVADLPRAEAFYEALGFAVVDRGDDRVRTRLSGPMDLELWEPHLGLADGRGGVHVDLGFGTADPEGAADAVAEWTGEATRVDGGIRVRDPDGHYLTFVRD